MPHEFRFKFGKNDKGEVTLKGASIHTPDMDAKLEVTETGDVEVAVTSENSFINEALDVLGQMSDKLFPPQTESEQAICNGHCRPEENYIDMSCPLHGTPGVSWQ